MTNKKTVHSWSDWLFFVLLLFCIVFIVMSELKVRISQVFLPFQYWKQVMLSDDRVIRDYFYYLLNGES